MSGHIDPYAVLGLSPGAGQREIRAAFRALARRYHPDVSGSDPAAERAFKRIVLAYEILGSPSRRARYDRRLHARWFGQPGDVGSASFRVEGELYHSDLGHHSDFYGPGDPITVSDAAGLVGCHPSTLRRRIRLGRLGATFDGRRYWLRRRDVERLVIAPRSTGHRADDRSVVDGAGVRDPADSETQGRDGRTLRPSVSPVS